MDYTNTDRLLIEYILTLLKFSETHHIDLEHLMENDWQTHFPFCQIHRICTQHIVLSVLWMKCREAFLSIMQIRKSK